MNHTAALIGLYWLLASFLTAAAWSITATLVKRTARAAALAGHRVGHSTCPCGGHQ